jgi:hypothetical protein
MSCSDKMARWNVLGVHGSLLALLMAGPVYVESVCVDEMFDEVSLTRSLVGRLGNVQGCLFFFYLVFIQHLFL